METTKYGINLVTKCSFRHNLNEATNKQAQICTEGCEGDDLCCFATIPQKYITGTKVRLYPRLDYAQVKSLVTILQG